MKIFVAGLWHLGSVVSACLSHAGHQIIGYDSNIENIQALMKGEAPIYEPQLNELILEAIHNKNLRFTSSPQDVMHANIIWLTFDTPVDNNDNADVDHVFNETKKLLPFFQPKSLLIVSSQLPVGSINLLQNLCNNEFPEKEISFACIPENLRLGKAIDVFTKTDRFVVGLENEKDSVIIESILNPFSKNFVWMSIESAEMTKHALNAFLATSVVFINELATLCEQVGANARDVERGLKTEERIGLKAYLRPGQAIAGGTLARDVNYLINIGKKEEISTPLFDALLTSNQHHKQWSCQKINNIFSSLDNKSIAIIGLSYKENSNILRRSVAVEIAQWLNKQGAHVLAFDPLLQSLPKHLEETIKLHHSLNNALNNVDAVIISSDLPQFSTLSIESLLTTMRHPLIIDPNGYYYNTFRNDQRVQYFSVGSCL